MLWDAHRIIICLGILNFWQKFNFTHPYYPHMSRESIPPPCAGFLLIVCSFQFCIIDFSCMQPWAILYHDIGNKSQCNVINRKLQLNLSIEPACWQKKLVLRKPSRKKTAFLLTLAGREGGRVVDQLSVYISVVQFM